ncbi:MAG: transglutaminase family protein [Planctomycetes bacterium]|nr:transglutaminase family protein [Planctomycetota bacterium]
MDTHPNQLLRAEPEPPPAERELATFASLLADESPVVHGAVCAELERRGRAALPLLRKIAVRGDARARSRARTLLVRAGRERIARRMIAFALSDYADLERGLLLMSRFEEPGLDLRPYVLAIDAMAAEVLRRVDARRGLDGRAKVLTEYLGRELGYRGDSDDYHHPDNVYLHRAIVRKRGLPLTLTAIYLLVARRAKIRASAVALPGHVVLRVYEEDGRSTIIDPFDAGSVLSERDCLEYLAQHGLPFQPRWFDDTAEVPLWTRHVHNLRKSYRRRGLEREVRWLDLLIVALERRTSA